MTVHANKKHTAAASLLMIALLLCWGVVLSCRLCAWDCQALVLACQLARHS